MATHAHTIRTVRRPFVIPVWRLKFFWQLRKDLLTGRLLVILGLAIPFLMFFSVLPINLWLGAIALGMVALGGLLLLICCGEIA